jgi:hypothetical protein
VVDEDGSPCGPRVYGLWNPPLVEVRPWLRPSPRPTHKLIGRKTPPIKTYNFKEKLRISNC